MRSFGIASSGRRTLGVVLWTVGTAGCGTMTAAPTPSGAPSILDGGWQMTSLDSAYQPVCISIDRGQVVSYDWACQGSSSPINSATRVASSGPSMILTLQLGGALPINMTLRLYMNDDGSLSGTRSQTTIISDDGDTILMTRR